MRKMFCGDKNIVRMILAFLSRKETFCYICLLEKETFEGNCLYGKERIDKAADCNLSKGITF